MRALLLLLPLCLLPCVFAQAPTPAVAVPAASAALPEPPPPLDKAEFRARREALARRLHEATDGAPWVAVVRGAETAPDMGPFVQDQDFLYLSGVREPGLALVLAGNADGELLTDELLVPPFSRFAATWNGDFLAPGDAAAEKTGFATVGNVRNLMARLTELLAASTDGKRPRLYTPTAAAARLGSTPGQADGVARSQQKDALDGRTWREQAFVDHLREAFAEPVLEVEPLEKVLFAMRPLKSPAEIALLRRSAEIAAEGIAEAMRCTAPGVYEFQLAAVARYVFSLRGAGPDAYAAIVGGGPNGCILHYSSNTRRLLATDLIVMDYAPTLQGYASDVTRTFPASGTFSPEQRKLVQDVHDIQAALLAEVKPGARLSQLGSKCAQMLKAKGYRSDHGPCHHVGLAVHDPSVDELVEGMVLTVEPGAYLRDQGMGCRIEDTVLVTKDGCEVLSAGVPSAPDAIEAWMQTRGVTSVPVGLGR